MPRGIEGTRVVEYKPLLDRALAVGHDAPIRPRAGERSHDDLETALCLLVRALGRIGVAGRLAWRIDQRICRQDACRPYSRDGCATENRARVVAIVRRQTNRNRTSRRMEFPSQNRRRPRRSSPETDFTESAAGGASRGDRPHAATRTCSYPRAISRRAATDFTARIRVAAGLSRFGNRRREALSYVAVSGKAFCAAFHLPLPELPARFPSRTQDQTHSRLSRLLPRA